MTGAGGSSERVYDERALYRPIYTLFSIGLYSIATAITPAAIELGLSAVGLRPFLIHPLVPAPNSYVR